MTLRDREREKKETLLCSRSRKEMPVEPDLLESPADKEEVLDQEIGQVRLAYISMNRGERGVRKHSTVWSSPFNPLLSYPPFNVL